MSTFGTTLLIVAMVVALLAVRYPRKSLAMLQLATLTLAFIALIYARLTNDFSLQNVAENSSRALPMLYKITGAWGNHEGSMLLWVWVLAVYGVALGWTSTNSFPLPLRKRGQHTPVLPVHLTALRVQSLFGAVFLLFILCTSNPFAPAAAWVRDGATLNPLLQDVGLAIHPPMLYLGYVGFSVVFSLAVAALLTGAEGRSFASAIHPFVLAAWTALTLGIGLGSWWAYRELGWGGWWFWDPVENASLLPWLSGTALLHSNVVLKKRGRLYAWVLLLAILTFALSLLGTFLVRSGVLNSVHSFASDPARGIFILALIGASVGSALVLYGLKTAQLVSQPMTFFSREGGMLINNLFLVVVCATVLLGTLYPLLAEYAFHEKITVGGPYYHKTVVPLLIVPLLLMALTPLLAWKKGGVRHFQPALPYMLSAAITAVVLVYVLALPHAAFAAMGMALAAWIFAGSVALFLRHRRRLTAAMLAVVVAHFGVSLLLAGITAEGLWSVENEGVLSAGKVLTLGDYTLFYEKETFEKRRNYITKIATVDIVYHDTILATLTPEYRFYPESGATTSEASYYSTALQDIYVAIGESKSGGRTAVRAYAKPLMSWIWAGFLVMALGGLIAFRAHRQKYST